MSEMRMPFWHGAGQLVGEDGPALYLQYLSDCLCYGLWKRGDQEKHRHWARFRRATDAIGISDVECADISFDAEVVALLSPGNQSALAWSRACIEYGFADSADPEDPASVIDRLIWPELNDCIG